MPSSVPSHAHAGRPARLGALLLAVLLGVLPAAAAGQSATAPVPPAQAAVQSAQAAGEQASTPADKPPSNFKWSWGNTLTYGLGFRVADADKRIIGVAAGGTAFSVNGDDGNQNYKKGLFTNAAKITSEFEFSYKQLVGGFVRGFAFYDFVNQNGDRARTPLTDAAKDRVGARAEFRDAFLWWRFKAGSRAGEIRGGWQVINWGESTFIQGGINAINPVDVSVLRVPGAELRDALLPVGAVKFSIKPSANTSFEAFYQYAWEETQIDPVGSYFSTSDLAGAGAAKVMLGFGSVPDTVAVGHAPLPPTYSPVGTAVPKRSEDLKARDDGQYGVAFRAFAPALGDTEFGLYFLNYHSRLPLIGARTGTAAGLFARQLRRDRGLLPHLPGRHQALWRQLQHPVEPDGHRAAGRGVAPLGRAAAGGRRGTALRGADAAAPAAAAAAAGAPHRAGQSAGEHRTRWAPTASRSRSTGSAASTPRSSR